MRRPHEMVATSRRGDVMRYLAEFNRRPSTAASSTSHARIAICCVKALQRFRVQVHGGEPAADLGLCCLLLPLAVSRLRQSAAPMRPHGPLP